MEEPSPAITISQAQYDQMLKKCKKLEALGAAGVDNWEGYDMAMEIMREENEAWAWYIERRKAMAEE